MGIYQLQKLLITVVVNAKRETYETFKQSFKKKDLVRNIRKACLEEISLMKFKQGFLCQNYPFQKLLCLSSHIM